MADPRVLLLHGEESFLIEEEARKVLGAWQEELVSDFGYEALDPAGVNVAKFRDAVRQLPFLDPFRVVVVRALQGRKADVLAPALKDVPETTRVLITVHNRLGAASPLVKVVSSAGAGMAREFVRLKGRSLGDWASNRAREQGLPPSIGPMVQRSAPADLGVIDSELRKLAAYQASGFPLDREALQALLAGGHEEEIFRVTDNLLPRPNAEAFKVARSLVRSGQSPTALAYRLSRHLALVLEARARRDRGESLAAAQAAMSEHPFVVQKAFETAGGVDADRLEEGLNVLLTYEWEVKSGQVDAELGLEGVLARL